MPPKRTWLQAELTLLVDLVTEDYHYLTDAFTMAKTKRHVDNKWIEIMQKINALGEGEPLTKDKVKKRWFDFKSTAKGAVSAYNKERTMS